MNNPDYIVKGMGAFPLDMLQHDNLTPATPKDAHLIAVSQQAGQEDQIFEIALNIQPGRYKSHLEYREWPFTERRWWSFGWKRVYQ